MKPGAPWKHFQVIPGVGPKIAEDLWRLGFRAVEDLKHQAPEAMLSRLNALTGSPVDRCMLYVFRAAVYYASYDNHDQEKLKWWFWKD